MTQFEYIVRFYRNRYIVNAIEYQLINLKDKWLVTLNVVMIIGFDLWFINLLIYDYGLSGYDVNG